MFLLLLLLFCFVFCFWYVVFVILFPIPVLFICLVMLDYFFRALRREESLRGASPAIAFSAEILPFQGTQWTASYVAVVGMVGIPVLN